MLNHLSIASLLKPDTFKNALDIYKKEIKTEVDSKRYLKEYLKSLNMFLYTYFLLEYNKDLENFSLKNIIYIDREDDPEHLASFGEKILRGYTNKFTTEVIQNDHEIIEETLNYINNNFSQKITLAKVSDKLHISKNYLCHLFKVQTGYKFCEYINIQRVNKAKKLIEENKKTFEYISFECGFSSQSHFSTTFKKYVGLTPNEYKRTIISE